ITCTIEFDHHAIGRQSYQIELGDERFDTEISGAGPSASCTSSNFFSSMAWAEEDRLKMQWP
ncbi:MAG: hypothetical protein KGY38_00430, partial [Desulfobacterales bacterium]|nr:hypothetical protein [Desulfobacterales bacterium]